MSKQYDSTPKFKLVVDHLKAVRVLHKYVTGVGLKEDMQDLSNHLQQDLSRDIFRPEGWQELYHQGGSLWSSPSPANKWRVVRGDLITVEICPNSPVDDDEPYVSLYVPKWKKRSQFIAKLKTPRGFRNDPPDEDAQSRPVFKYVPYTDYLGADGVFDPRGFIDGFREAARVLVAMEKAINKILEHLAWKLIRAALRLWWREL